MKFNDHERVCELSQKFDSETRAFLPETPMSPKNHQKPAHAGEENTTEPYEHPQKSLGDVRGRMKTSKQVCHTSTKNLPCSLKTTENLEIHPKWSSSQNPWSEIVTQPKSHRSNHKVEGSSSQELTKHVGAKVHKVIER